MRIRLLACAALLLLAGCSGPDQDAETGPPAGDAANPIAQPIRLADLASEDCAYNDLIWFVPTADAQALLPVGFTARELQSGIGALIINAFDCGGTFAWNGWDLFVFAQTPTTFPGIVETFDAANRTPRGTGEHYELDLYSLAAHTDHAGLAAVFERAGIPVGPGTHSRQVSDAAGETSVALGQLSAGGMVLGQVVAAGTIVPDPAGLGGYMTAHHRQWHVTAEGTLLIERVMTNDGDAVTLTQGPGSCFVHPTTEFFAIVGPRSCNFSQDAVGGLDWTGGAYFFPGVKPA